jgi:hypothetical protein
MERIVYLRIVQPTKKTTKRASPLSLRNEKGAAPLGKP